MMAADNGREPTVGRLLGASGLGVAALTLAWTSLESARHEAKTALDVAAQHGSEINGLRDVHRDIWADLARLRAQADIGGRFTQEDGERLEVQIERLRARVERLESRLFVTDTE